MASPIKSSDMDMMREVLGPEEASKALMDLLANNPDDEEMILSFIEELSYHNGDLSQLVGLTHKPISFDDFLDDPYFLKDAISLWPEVRKAGREICEGGYVQALLMGGIGIGKTTLAQAIQAYQLYLMSCERWPQARYGLSPNSAIVIAMLNRTSDLAKDVTFGEFRGFIEAVPYFKDQFAYDEDKEASLVFPKRIRIEYSAAFSTTLLGKNVIGAIADEMNFQARIEKSKLSLDGGSFDQAERVYRSLVLRRKSRFLKQGKLPGCLCVVSSANYAGDFTDRMKKEVEAQKDGLTYVWDHPQWEVIPPEKFSGVKFPLEVGDERRNSRILNDVSEATPGARVLMVPIEYKQDFKNDMQTTLADVAGITIASSRPFFYDRDRVWSIADAFAAKGHAPLWEEESVVLQNGFPTVTPGYQIIRPERPRAIHIDLAVRGDACGIAMGYIEGLQAVARLGDKGKRIVDELPCIVFDALLQIKAPRGGEIEFGMVRELIYDLSEMGFPIKWVTLDGFQSVDTRQILKRQGYNTDLLSVEGREAYESLRAGIWQGRVAAPQHRICLDELCFLELDKDAKNVDHLPSKSKDVSDAMAGVYNGLVMRRASWRMEVPLVPVKDPKTGRTRQVMAPYVGSASAERREISRRDVVRR